MSHNATDPVVSSENSSGSHRINPPHPPVNIPNTTIATHPNNAVTTAFPVEKSSA